MAHFQREFIKKKQRYEQGIQSQLDSVIQRFSNQSFTSNNYQNKSETYSGMRNPILRSQNIGKLVQGFDKRRISSKQVQDKAKNSAVINRKNPQLNLMQIQDQRVQPKANESINVEQIVDRETYLSNLDNQLNLLKSKITALQVEQNEPIDPRNVEVEHRGKGSKTIDPVLDRSRTIQQRKSYCGRIYTRLKTPSSGRSVKFGGKDSQVSSYYKWRPKVDQNNFFDEGKLQTDMVYKTPQHFPSTAQGRRKVGSQLHKPISNYRVKQKNINKLITDQINEHKAGQKVQQNPQKSQLKAKKVQPEPYKGVVFQRQPVMEWEITKIEDDFRQKILKKLQIPKSFPLPPPEVGLTFEEYQKLGLKIFELFGVKPDRQKNKIITRKFKNGLYYQLDIGKNVIWYYSGTFYFGDWQVDLPTQSQKNGFGFEYVPNKYIYLGFFKDGMRHGKGTIQIFSSNPDAPNDFMGYDGEWAHGKPHGFGKHIDQKNTKYIGNFIAGQKTGKSIILNKQGLYYEGEIKKNLKHGQGCQKLTNGDTYTGQFQDGKFSGFGTYNWKNGSVYEGDFANGKRQGKGKWKGPNGDQFEGEYYEDLKNGWGKFTWANGEIYQGQFRNDLRHGEGNYRHPNGKVGKFMWIDGQIDHRIYTKEEEIYRCRNQKEPEAAAFE